MNHGQSLPNECTKIVYTSSMFCNLLSDTKQRLIFSDSISNSEITFHLKFVDLMLLVRPVEPKPVVLLKSEIYMYVCNNIFSVRM